MRTEVIKALKMPNNNEKFNKLLKLFMATKGHSIRLARYYNIKLYTPGTLETLTYDVQKLHKIKDTEIIGKVVPIEPNKTAKEKLVLIDFENDGADVLLDFAKDHPELSTLNILLPEDLPEFFKGAEGTAQMKAWLKEHGAETKQTRKAEVLKVVNEVFSKLITSAENEAVAVLKTLQAEMLKTETRHDDSNISEETKNSITAAYTEAPEDVKSAVKFRKEFDFLAEDDCPIELKALVTDKFTALENFETAREEIKALVAAGQTDALYELAATVVENWEVNQEIYDELNYYAEHKEILGKHPVFADMMLEKSVNDLSIPKLAKRQATLRTYISKETPKFDKAEGEAKAAIGLKLAQWKKELDLVDVRLEASDK